AVRQAQEQLALVELDERRLRSGVDEALEARLAAHVPLVVLADQPSEEGVLVLVDGEQAVARPGIALVLQPLARVLLQALELLGAPRLGVGAHVAHQGLLEVVGAAEEALDRTAPMRPARRAVGPGDADLAGQASRLLRY